MKKSDALIAAIPALLAVLIYAWLHWGLKNTSTIYLRGDLGSVIAMIGFILSGILLIILIARRYHNHSLQSLIKQTNEKHRRFLQRLDHELKNPLTAIMAGLANLNTSHSAQETAMTTTLNSITGQVKRLNKLSSDLRKLSDLETIPLELTPVDMNELLENVYLSIQENPEASQRQLNLSIPHAPWPLPHIPADPDLLFLAIYNLVHNALKFTQTDDTIELRAHEDNAQIIIEVADTGPGIPTDEIDHVWEELYRAKTARGISGSGLGLPLVRAIINRHHGEVNLRSRINQGTVFSIRLPTHTVTKL